MLFRLGKKSKLNEKRPKKWTLEIFWTPFEFLNQKAKKLKFMIPAFHDYSLETKITKCGDLLYNVCSTIVCTIVGRKERVLSRLTFYHISCINCLQYATFNLILCKKIGRIIEHDYVKMLLKYKILLISYFHVPT